MGSIRSRSQALLRDHERELLLRCIAPNDSDPDRAKEIHSCLEHALNWKILLEQAIKLDADLLLYRSLKYHGFNVVPEEVLTNLSQRFYANAQRNNFQVRCLLDLMNLFASYGIRAIQFKGPSLASTVYGDLRIRRFSDLDILISKSDIGKTKNLLNSLDYRIKELEFEFHAYRFDGKVNVDVHWNFAGQFVRIEPNFERLWNRSVSRLLSQGSVRQLSPEDLLIVLCVYLIKDGWPRRLTYARDIAHLISTHTRLDWDHILTSAKTSRQERILRFGLLLANELLDTNSPVAAAKHAQVDRITGSLAVKASQKIFEDRKFGLGDVIFFMKLRENRRDKVAVVLGTAIRVNEKDRDRLPLPKFLFFLYYIRRVIRLILTYGNRV